MEKLFLYILISGILSSNLPAQDVKIKAVPYVMHFENFPAGYEILGEDHIRIESPPKSDLFISPDGKYVTNKSPRLIFKPDPDFILTAKISLEFKSNWDAGDLIIYNDGEHWAKFCFERDFKGQARVVSVVCNRVADDCNSMAVQGNKVYYRIAGSKEDNKFGLYYSGDGKSWFPVRIFALHETDKLKIGFCAQSPVGEGTIVDFSEIEYRDEKITDWWNCK